MGFFDTDPEKQRERDEQKAQRSQEKDEKRFLKSPAGQARTAYLNGDQFFQIDLPHSELRNEVSMLAGNIERTRTVRGGTDILGSIAAEGWDLRHTGWVFVETGTDSRDKLIKSGQQTVTKGQVIGIYLFERKDA